MSQPGSDFPTNNSQEKCEKMRNSMKACCVVELFASLNIIACGGQEDCEQAGTIQQALQETKCTGWRGDSGGWTGKRWVFV